MGRHSCTMWSSFDLCEPVQPLAQGGRMVNAFLDQIDHVIEARERIEMRYEDQDVTFSSCTICPMDLFL